MYWKLDDDGGQKEGKTGKWEDGVYADAWDTLTQPSTASRSGRGLKFECEFSMSGQRTRLK